MGNTDQVFLDFPWKLSRFYLDYGVIEVPNSVPSQCGESPSPRRALSRTGDSPELLPSSRENMFRIPMISPSLSDHPMVSNHVRLFSLVAMWLCLLLPNPDDLRGPYKTDLSLEQLRRPPCIEGTAADELHRGVDLKMRHAINKWQCEE